MGTLNYPNDPRFYASWWGNRKINGISGHGIRIPRFH
jgi:hypothetical protein